MLISRKLGGLEPASIDSSRPEVSEAEAEALSSEAKAEAEAMKIGLEAEAGLEDYNTGYYNIDRDGHHFDDRGC